MLSVRFFPFSVTTPQSMPWERFVSMVHYNRSGVYDAYCRSLSVQRPKLRPAIEVSPRDIWLN